MYTRILVAIDGSIFSEQVLHQAVALSHLTQARLLLLHVSVSGQSSACTLGEGEPDQCNIETLRSHRETALAAGTIADLRLPAGAPAQQICQVAQEWGADLILMGHRSLANLDKLLTQSVSRYVLDHAPCSLLIVPDHIKAPLPPQAPAEAAAPLSPTIQLSQMTLIH
ncbi:universal stress protein [Phormidium tenue FACHB-886]|nr:universal stress protein [Phormidium tenue FACHB-886]